MSYRVEQQYGLRGKERQLYDGQTTGNELLLIKKNQFDIEK